MTPVGSGGGGKCRAAIVGFNIASGPIARAVFTASSELFRRGAARRTGKGEATDLRGLSSVVSSSLLRRLPGARNATTPANVQFARRRRAEITDDENFVSIKRYGRRHGTFRRDKGGSPMDYKNVVSAWADRKQAYMSLEILWE